MDTNQIATWRDAALTLLALDTILLGLLPAAAIYWGLRGTQRLRQWMRPVLFQTRLHMWQAQHETERAMSAIAAPFVWLQSLATGLQRALQMLGWR